MRNDFGVKHMKADGKDVKDGYKKGGKKKEKKAKGGMKDCYAKGGMKTSSAPKATRHHRSIGGK